MEAGGDISLFSSCHMSKLNACVCPYVLAGNMESIAYLVLLLGTAIGTAVQAIVHCGARGIAKSTDFARITWTVRPRR